MGKNYRSGLAKGHKLKNAVLLTMFRGQFETSAELTPIEKRARKAQIRKSLFMD